MCMICNEVEIPEWSQQKKREFVASWEDVEPDTISDELIDEYELLFDLALIEEHYGVLAVPKEWRDEFMEKHCCIGKVQDSSKQ